jgi:hypothetical protein
MGEKYGPVVNRGEREKTVWGLRYIAKKMRETMGENKYGVC